MSLKTSLSMYRNLPTGIRGEYSISAEVVWQVLAGVLWCCIYTVLVLATGASKCPLLGWFLKVAANIHTATVTTLW